jgi:hypothetical protein
LRQAVELCPQPKLLLCDLVCCLRGLCSQGARDVVELAGKAADFLGDVATGGGETLAKVFQRSLTLRGALCRQLFDLSECDA